MRRERLFVLITAAAVAACATAPSSPGFNFSFARIEEQTDNARVEVRKSNGIVTVTGVSYASCVGSTIRGQLVRNSRSVTLIVHGYPVTNACIALNDPFRFTAIIPIASAQHLAVQYKRTADAQPTTVYEADL